MDNTENRRKTLILMRHGQTIFNEKMKIQGWCDSPLTEKGIAQAKKAHELLLEEGVRIDAVYSSTSERAMDTAMYASGRDEIPHLNKDLKERHYGEMEGETRRITACFTKEEREHFYVATHGEPSEVTKKRVSRAIDSIMEKEEGTVLVVSHGESISLFCNEQIENAIEIFGTHVIGNCSMIFFTYEDGKYEYIKRIDVE